MLKALIVEDHLAIAQLLTRLCEQRRLKPTVVPSLALAYDRVDHNHFDVCLLDLVLPDGDAFELIAYLHLLHLSLPIFILSSKVDVASRVRALRDGADDYVTKPFSVEEVGLRIRNLLTKSKIDQPRSWQLGQAVFFPEERIIFDNGTRIALGDKESSLLQLFLRRRGFPISRDEILDQVWGERASIQSKTVDCYVRRLRAKTPALGSITTIRGNGYVMRSSSI